MKWLIVVVTICTSRNAYGVQHKSSRRELSVVTRQGTFFVLFNKTYFPNTGFQYRDVAHISEGP